MCDATRFRIRISGQDMPETWRWHSRAVSLILPESGVARLRLAIPQDMPDWQGWKGGEPIALSLGYADEMLPLFEGELVGMRFERDANGLALVSLEARDLLHRLGRSHRQRVFQQVTEGGLVRKLASEHSLLAKVTDPGVVHPTIAQLNCTDLELLQARAARIGYAYWVERKTLNFAPARTGGKPVTLSAGASLKALETLLSVAGVAPELQVLGYDALKGQRLTGRARAQAVRPTVPGRKLGAKSAGTAFPAPPASLGLVPVRSVKEADAVAKGQLEARARRFAVARGVCGGTSRLAPGGKLTLEGVPKQSEGDWEICGVEHYLDGQGGYETRFEARRNVA